MDISHRGKANRLTTRQRRWLKRRQAVEPVIGHLKNDRGMACSWMKGQLGDEFRCTSFMRLQGV